MDNKEKDEILHIRPGIWMRKSQLDTINKWGKERQKQFHEWLITPKTDTNMSSDKTDVVKTIK